MLFAMKMEDTSGQNCPERIITTPKRVCGSKQSAMYKAAFSLYIDKKSTDSPASHPSEAAEAPQTSRATSSVCAVQIKYINIIILMH